MLSDELGDGWHDEERSRGDDDTNYTIEIYYLQHVCDELLNHEHSRISTILK